MAKAPADQFYFGDYIRDTRSLSLAARGAWMDILAHGFFKLPQGRISQDLDAWATMFGCPVDTAKSVLDQIKKHQVGDVVTERNGDVTVMNRRQFNQWQEREANKHRVADHRERKRAANETGGNGKCNADVQKCNPLSSSSSSSSSSEDFKEIDRYVHACVKEHSECDPRLVEIAIIETMVRRKGSLGEHRPIKSIKYFEAEIKQMCSKKAGGALADQTIDALLMRRRQQIGIATPPDQPVTIPSEVYACRTCFDTGEVMINDADSVGGVKWVPCTECEGNSTGPSPA